MPTQLLGAILTVRHDGVIEGASHEWADIIGYTRDEMVGRTCWEFVHPDDLNQSQQLSDEAADQGAPVTLTFSNRWRHRDGLWVRIMWTAVEVLSDRHITHGVVVPPTYDDLQVVTDVDAVPSQRPDEDNGMPCTNCTALQDEVAQLRHRLHNIDGLAAVIQQAAKEKSTTDTGQPADASAPPST